MTFLLFMLCIIMFASILLFLIGLISPTKSMFWLKGKPATKAESSFVYGIALIASFILFGTLSDNKYQETSNQETSSASEESKSGRTAEPTRIGNVLRTRYFDVKVNKASVVDRVNTGNPYSDVRPDRDNYYLILNITFKNIDNESRMIANGDVIINYNNKDYTFDKSESIFAEGFGLLDSQINPLTSKTTNLVYKIPREIKGMAYYHPGRSDDDQVIFLGKLN